MGRRHARGRTDRSRPGDLCWLEERGRNPRGISPAVVRFDPPGHWAQSTSGSAPRLQRDACRFEPGWVHPCGRGGIGRRAGLRPRWAHTHESSTLSARTRAPLAQLVERWTLNPCRRGFESLGAHSTGFRSLHLVVAQLGRAPGSGPGGQRFESVQPDERCPGIACFREWSSGMDARLWTERRWFDPIFPSTGEARSTPPHAAVAQSGERRLVTAEAAGSKPACGARPWW